jgi:WD40 repeat protein
VKYWLASGSRDRLTQIFEATGDKYENVTILEDHSSTITAVKFSEERSVKGQKRLKLISCGADKQLVFRNIDLSIVQNNDVRKLQNMNTEDFIVV